MPRRATKTAAEEIVDALRAVGWWNRHVRWEWLAARKPILAELVAALMGPDELLYGYMTGYDPTDEVIVLKDKPSPRKRQLTIYESFERSVRNRS